MNGIFKKCKSLSKLGRTSSYGSSTTPNEPTAASTPTRINSSIYPGDEINPTSSGGRHAEEVVVFVGSSKRPYVIGVKHLNHPLLCSLLEKAPKEEGGGTTVKCEVVLFDHLLWMLENVDLDVADSLEELVDLYAY